MRITMKTKIFYLTAMALCLSGGCKETNSRYDNISTFTPLAETKEIRDLSPYIEDMEMVKVADDDRLLMSDVSKMLLDRSGNMYILDYMGNLVTMKPDGTFYRQIANRGRASNEYIGISDIALTDRALIVLDGPHVRFFDLHDSACGKTVDIPVEAPCDAVAPCGEDSIYLFSAFPANIKDAAKEKDDLLYKVDAEGDIVSTDITRHDCTFSMSNISQSRVHDYYLRPQDNGHIFYRLGSDKIEAAYRIDFQDKTIPERYYFKKADEDIMTYMMSNYYKLPMDLHETDTHLYFHAAGPGASDCIFLYDKRSMSGIRWESAPGEVTVPVPVLSSDSEWFYTIFPELASGMDVKGDPLYDSIVSALRQTGKNELSGPYIVKFKLKGLTGK